MQLAKIAVTLVVAIVLSFSSILNAEHDYMQVRIFYENADQLRELQEMGLDIIGYQEGYIEIVTSPAEHLQILAKDFKTNIIHEDLVAFYQSRLDPTKDMGGYMTLSEINAYIDELIASNPGIVSSKISLGQTIEGRDMWAFKISDNPEVDEDEPEILYTAAIHAREVITPLVVKYFVDYLVENYPTDPDAQFLVDNREMWFVMCVNPDGYYYNEAIAPEGGGMWRKNRRDNGDGTFGVDLNRNFDYMWGYNNSGSSPYTFSETYRGTAPFSEPEIQNMRDFHIAHDFQIAVYFHSFGNVLFTAWAYNSSFPEDADIFLALADSVNSLNGYAVGVGASSTNGSADDWVYGEQTLKNKCYAFIWEVGTQLDGFWPAPQRIPILIEENLESCKFMAEIAGGLDSLYQLRPPEAPLLTAPDTSQSPDYEVSWILDDTLNPAVEYELLELTDYQKITDPGEDFENMAANNGFEISSNRYHSGPTSFYSGDEITGFQYLLWEFNHEIEENDTLGFWTYYETNEHYDYIYVVAISNDTGYVLPGNITTTANPNGFNPGHAISGSSNGWIEAKFDLSEFAGRFIALALVYTRNGLGFFEGVYFDDIYPFDYFQTENHINISGGENSYIFIDKTENEYYYRIRAKDADDQWGGFSNIEKTLVYFGPQYICGDPNADQNVNISDAVYIVNYVFIGGAPPDPMESGDASCDGNVNVSDAVWIINYIFMGTGDPCDTDDDGFPDC
ncbi:MAG: hypothetical protein GWO41_16275 [candidate division Zixibacteria bacterium]|nr:hypothetical protein [candidate division Zixibacteria bacterium]NIR63532.1 hypothetical protein [candidate division Zixibacteria bacterium]NIS17966.1 hypothetical protein [candidate division Zixibacteria bacterium]NIS46242.1 hypothetical protein [candidate division Zixibacteria bacterium]NIT54249.1 hypothetical protein [candidate division Zixibacteria bacterium]